MIFNLEEKLKLIENVEAVVDKLTQEVNSKKRDIFDLRQKIRDHDDALLVVKRRAERAEREAQMFKEEMAKCRYEIAEIGLTVDKKKKKIQKLKEQLAESYELKPKYDALLKEKEYTAQYLPN